MFFRNKEEYEEYLEQNGISENDSNIGENYFKWTDDGYILLDTKQCKPSSIDVDQYYFCKGWILLADKSTMALLKNPYGDIRRDITREEYNLSLYNNILVPQIATQLENRGAQYYLTKIKKGKTVDKRTYILTLDFKHKNETLIHGEEILDDMEEGLAELNIDKLIDITCKYFEKNNCSKHDIEIFRQDFIKQSFFNRFIKHEDEHNKNWAILMNEKNNRVRLAPSYDIDCSCELNKKGKISRKTNDGSLVSLQSFLEQYKDEEWFKKYIGDVIEKFDLEKAFKDAEKETFTRIPDECKNSYRNFFGHRFFELKQAYKTIFMDKTKEEGTIEVER